MKAFQRVINLVEVDYTDSSMLAKNRSEKLSIELRRINL